MDCTIRIAKTKALISCAVSAQLICVFVFAYAKNLFVRKLRIITVHGLLVVSHHITFLVKAQLDT